MSKETIKSIVGNHYYINAFLCEVKNRKLYHLSISCLE